MTNNQYFYLCPDCGWQGDSDEMNNTYDEGYDGENEYIYGSMNACPECGFDFGTYELDDKYLVKNVESNA